MLLSTNSYCFSSHVVKQLPLLAQNGNLTDDVTIISQIYIDHASDKERVIQQDALPANYLSIL